MALAGLSLPRVSFGPPPAAAQDLPCRVEHARRVAPLQREIGQQVTVSLSVELTCESRARPLDLIIVMDASPGISRASLSSLKLALSRAIDHIELVPGEAFRMAILAYDDRGLLDGDIQLSGDPELVLRALRRVEPGARPCVSVPSNCGASAALRRAAELLDDSAQPGSRRVVVLATAGIGARSGDPDYEWQVPCNELGQSTGNLRARRDGTVVATACASDESGFCRSRCLTNKSSDDERFAFLSETASWSPLELGLPALAGGSGNFHPVEQIEIIDRLPPALAYEGGDLPGVRDGQLLSWTGYPLTRTWRIDLDYVLGIRNCGQVPSSEDAAYTLSYLGPMWGGLIQSDSLAIPMIDVQCESITTPTASLTPATPIPSVTPSPRLPSPSPTVSPSATPRSPGRVFLPILLARECAGEGSRLPQDWVLALDVSGSMARPAGPPFGDANRWTAAREVARALLGSMRPELDRVSVLQFGEAGELVESPGGLMPCCARALAELENNPQRMRNGHPWVALSRARSLLETAPALGGQRRPGIIFLTDIREGDLGPSEDALMLHRSSEARQAGIAIHVVVLGEQPDPVFAARWTGRPSRALDGSRLSFPLAGPVRSWLRCTP